MSSLRLRDAEIFAIDSVPDRVSGRRVEEVQTISLDLEAEPVARLHFGSRVDPGDALAVDLELPCRERVGLVVVHAFRAGHFAASI